jgi:hypothetical protein
MAAVDYLDGQTAVIRQRPKPEAQANNRSASSSPLYPTEERFPTACLHSNAGPSKIFKARYLNRQDISKKLFLNKE